ncbi:MAG: pyrroline-5-carboxylate reductase [Corynebacterium sp.]|nr:pyrroline-5-carboxylate reductase [Corynebacterium sp.]
MEKIAILGGGQIGEALAGGLVAAGVDASHIVVTNRRESRGEYFAETYGVRTSCDNAAAVQGADVIFAAVKPYAVASLLEEIQTQLNQSTVVVSMAAGVELATLQRAAGDNVPVVRAMPNTPMLVGNGMNIVVPGSRVSTKQMDMVTRLLSTVGRVVELEESKMDVAAALSGSGPAYFFLVAEALVDAGVSLGLTRDVAEELAYVTAAGAGQMLAESDKGAGQLRYGVSSPGGTTYAAIRELEESGIRGAFYRAIDKCSEHSARLR